MGEYLVVQKIKRVERTLAIEKNLKSPPSRINKISTAFCFSLSLALTSKTP
jgi:hypothetical protein